ncbi:MAG TPA: hypothetical protein DIC57_10930 [Sphaerochaeta sp.]|nr:hypothetical protein [Sphaerochaeta sp.]
MQNRLVHRVEHGSNRGYCNSKLYRKRVHACLFKRQEKRGNNCTSLSEQVVGNRNKPIPPCIVPDGLDNTYHRTTIHLSRDGF